MTLIASKADTANNLHRKIQLIKRIRFQLLGAFLVAIALPVALRTMNNTDLLDSTNIIYSVISSLIAIILGFVTWRRFASFATVDSVGYVLWSFLTFFLIVMTVLFFFRLDYSRFIFFTSMGLTLVWFSAIHLWISQKHPARLAVVKAGDLSELPEGLKVNTFTLTEPKSDSRISDGVVIDLRYDHSPEWEAFITDLTLRGIPVFHYKQIVEDITGQVSINHLHENSFGSLLPNSIYLRLKNRLEQGLALVALPFILLICGFAALAILVFDGRPILYAQTRMGFRGRPFTAYKFRTMSNNASGKSSIDDAMTKEKDPRITRLGSFLRKYRIDELPQVFNILRGEMGLIGPRPEALELSNLYEKELIFYRYRHAVRPGITGWAQVHQGHVTSVSDVNEKLKYDFYYIKKISIWLDLLIMLKTVKIIFFGIGAK